ncbi:MAG: acyloxyacyl hydrolase [Marinilabiliaceae bacterium]|nr:acyloxyacyl hydrolase [Marinilabiliaceae bacterium]
MLISFSSFSYAQIKTETSSSQKHYYLTTRYHYGIVVPHHTSMAYLIEDYSRGFEITVGRSNFGKENWERYFNYPELGVGFYYGTFGNPDVYGDGMALFPYCNFNIYRSQKFTAHYKVSLGIGYATKPFRMDENIYNSVFGSHLNAYVGFGLIFDYRLLKKWSVSTALSLNHLSNGGIKKPNNGINTATLTIGTKYHFNTNKTVPSTKYETPKSKLKELLFVGFCGQNQGASYSPKSYPSLGISTTHLWHNTIKRSFGIGVDMMYFGGAPYLYFQEKEKESYSFNEKFYGGLFIAYHKMMGKTEMFLNLGAYIIQGIKPSQPIYPRVGLRYNITNHLVAHFGIKASFFTAEYLEFGLGYRLKYKTKQK